VSFNSRYGLVLFSDILGFSIAAVVAYLLRSAIEVPGHVLLPFPVYTSFFLVMIGSLLVWLHVHAFYGPIFQKDWSGFLTVLFRVNYNFLISVAVISFALRLTSTNRILLFLFLIFSNLLIFLTRFVIFPGVPKRLAILGEDQTALEAYQSALQMYSLRKITFVGFYSLDTNGADYFGKQRLPYQGPIGNLFKAIREKRIDILILALPNHFAEPTRVIEDIRAPGLQLLVARRMPPQVVLVPTDS